MPPGVEHELEVERRELVVPEQLAAEELAHQGKLLGRRVARGREHIAHDRELALRSVLEQGEEEVVLAREVRVHGALGEPGGGRDLVERRTVEALAGEHDTRGLQQVPAGQCPPPLGGQRHELRVAGLDCGLGCHTAQSAGY